MDIALDEVVGLFAVVEVPEDFSWIVVDVLVVVEGVSVVVTGSTNNVNYTIMN